MGLLPGDDTVFKAQGSVQLGLAPCGCQRLVWCLQHFGALWGAPLERTSACISNAFTHISSCLMPESRDEKPGLLGQQLHSQTGKESPLHLLIFMDL